MEKGGLRVNVEPHGIKLRQFNAITAVEFRDRVVMFPDFGDSTETVFELRNEFHVVIGSRERRAPVSKMNSKEKKMFILDAKKNHGFDVENGLRGAGRHRFRLPVNA